MRAVRLADLAAAGRLVECGCTACGLVEHLAPAELGLALSIEIPHIARWWQCRRCGARNSPTAGPVWVRPDPRVDPAPAS